MKSDKLKLILFLFLLSLLFFYKAAIGFDQGPYPAFDIYYSSFAEKAIFAHSILAYKSLPLWMPYVFSGSPFLGNPTSAMFYPFNLLFIFLPIGLAFGYISIINSLLIGTFTYLYARTIKIDKFGSLISGISIMFSGPMVTSVFAGHPILSNTFIWFPLALLFSELAIVKKKLVFLILTGITISLMLFAGAPQIAIYEIFSLLIYFILRSLFEIKNIHNFLKLISFFSASVIIGILITAIQLLPSIEFSKLSQRGSEGISYLFASDFSLHPYQIVSFISPFFFGSPINGSYWGKGNFWELNGYIGALPLLFALLAIVFKKNRYVFIFFIVGISALFYAIGKYGFVFPFFYHHIPGFNNFRVPARFLFIYVFSFSILAGIGASFLVNTFLNKINRMMLKLSILISAMFLIFIGILLLAGTNNSTVSIYEKYVLRNSFAVGINHSALYSQTKDDILVLFTLLLSLFIAIVIEEKNKIKMRQLKIFIVFLTFLNLWWFGARFIDTKSIKEIYEPTPLIERILKDKGTYRAFDMEGAYIHLLGKNNIESVTGVSPLYLKNYRNFLWATGKYIDTSYDSFFNISGISNPIFLNLLNVKYVIANRRMSVRGLSEIAKSNANIGHFAASNHMYYLYQNSNFLPRAYIVPNAIVLSDKQKVLSLLADNFDPKKYIIIEKMPKNIDLTNSSNYRSIEIVRNNYNSLDTTFELTGSGFLVLSEINYPGWTAYDNGIKTEILNANYIFRSIYVKSGKHKITFEYKPRSYTFGGIISLVTLLSCCIVLYIKRPAIWVREK